MKVEFLYPELTNLLGENGSQMLLKKIFGEKNCVMTTYPSPPSFIKEEIKLVIMGAMTEDKQKLILSLLLPFKKDIQERIEAGQFFFFTGNAMDLLGKNIYHEDEEALPGLGFFDFDTHVAKYQRKNEFVHGYTEKGTEIFGWISQFTDYLGDLPAFIHSGEKKYGIHYKNLYATSLLGPLLITSPYFTKDLLREMSMDEHLPEEESIMMSFKKRKNDMKKNSK